MAHGFVSQTSNACLCGASLDECEVASAGAYVPPTSRSAPPLVCTRCDGPISFVYDEGPHVFALECSRGCGAMWHNDGSSWAVEVAP